MRIVSSTVGESRGTIDIDLILQAYYLVLGNVGDIQIFDVLQLVYWKRTNPVNLTLASAGGLLISIKSQFLCI